MPRSPGKVMASKKGQSSFLQPAKALPLVVWFGFGSFLLQSKSLVLEELKPSYFKKKKILYL